MVLFAFALEAHNPFLGFDGDFDKAAAACFKTAVVFLALALLSLASFVLSAVRAKMGPPPPAQGEYQSV